MGTLYVVATPLGNLEDISPRAVRVLREVRLIAAEDTRHTRKLLAHFDIHTELTSYFEHNQRSKRDYILRKLEEGDVALVSDAGTPGINDPGYDLIRAALDSGFDVRPVPGPSAPIAALSVSGLPTDTFLYLGYLPHKRSERRRFLQQVAHLPYTLIFLESPHRLMESLHDLLEILGDRPACIAREMTKLFEDFWRGPLQRAIPYFSTAPVRGEFTLVIGGAPQRDVIRWSEEQLQAAIEQERQSGKPARQIAADLAARSGWSKREVYAHLHRSSETNALPAAGKEHQPA